MIKGSFYGIEEGSGGKRVLLGFGSGVAELRTAVEGYQMTATGLHRLGGGTTDSGSGKMPGMVTPWPSSPRPRTRSVWSSSVR